MQQAQLVVVSRVGLAKVILVVEANTKSHSAHDLLSGGIAFPVEIGHEGTEAGKHVLREPDVGLLGVLLGADFVTLLKSPMRMPWSR